MSSFGEAGTFIHKDGTAFVFDTEAGELPAWVPIDRRSYLPLQVAAAFCTCVKAPSKRAGGDRRCA